MRAGRVGMAPKITVASTSLQSVIGDIDANMKKAKEVIAKAADRGAEVIVFPELYLPGYACGESDKCFELSEPIPGPSSDALGEP
jgi:predicted amidohydrolase